MKEAFWGVLIIILGLLGVVIVNLFQNVTIDNDRVYYLIKESTEAASLDAIDLSYYRLNGTLRMVEDKFIENLTRRFAENVTVGDYVIVVEDLNEVPPKISLRVRSGVTSLKGEKFGIVNRVDAVLETKYSLEEVLDFLDITEEEWYSSISKTKIEIDSSGKNICKVGLRDDEELSCMPGDLMFTGFSDSNLNKSICQDENVKRNVERVANYKECECGTWVDKKENVYANPVKSGNVYNYTWTFKKTGEIRNIEEKVSEKVLVSTCTTDINIMVPKKPDELSPDTNPNESSDDNSSYIECPKDGIKIVKGTTVTLHPKYIPANASNRRLTWTSSKTDIISLVSSNPSNSCILNSTNSNCLSKATITGLKEGTSIITVKTTRGQTDTCKVTVWDGTIDSLKCTDITIDYNEEKQMTATYEPKNSTKLNFEWSLNKTDAAVIDKKTGIISGRNNSSPNEVKVTVKVKETNTKKEATCTAIIKGKACPSGSYKTEKEAKNSITCNNINIVENNGCYKAECKDLPIPTPGPTPGDPNCKPYVQKNEKVKANQGSSTIIFDKLTGDYIIYYYEVVNFSYSNGQLETKCDCATNKKIQYCKGVRWAYYLSGKPEWQDTPQVVGHCMCGGGSCFPAGTKVITQDSTKDIDKIKIGDMVLSYNTDANKNEYRKVLNVFVHENSAEKLYSLTINGKIIEVTENHRFYIKKGNTYDWIAVKNLKIKDMVMDKDGNYHTIDKITYKNLNETVYNIEVENNHNYYVGDGILVHNEKSALVLN